MRQLLMFLPVLAALLVCHSTEAAPPTLSMDSGQNVVQVAPAVPTSVDIVAVDIAADVRPIAITSEYAVTNDGASAAGVLLRDFFTGLAGSTSNSLTNTTADKGATATGRRAAELMATRLLC
jgi:hypothetical protein